MATKIHCLSLLVLLVAILLTITLRERMKENNEVEVAIAGEFDYYLLALAWTPSLCTGTDLKIIDPDPCNNKAKTMDVFSIHGLWPQNFTGKQPRDCSGPAYNYNKISMLEPELSSRYPSLLKKFTDQEFWKHEWDSHGTCSGLPIGEFFSQILNLNKRFDPLSTLHLIPGTIIDPVRDVVDEWNKIYQLFPRVTCNFNIKNQNVEQLKEIQLSFDKNYQLISNGRGVKSTCKSSSVQFPKH